MKKTHYFLEKVQVPPPSAKQYQVQRLSQIPQNLLIQIVKISSIPLQKEILHYQICQDTHLLLSFISLKPIKFKAFCLNNLLCLITKRKMLFYLQRNGFFKLSETRNGNFSELLNQDIKILKNLSEAQNYLLISPKILSLLQISQGTIDFFSKQQNMRSDYSLVDAHSFLTTNDKIMVLLRNLLLIFNKKLELKAKIPLFDSLASILASEQSLFIKTEKQFFYAISCNSVQYYQPCQIEIKKQKERQVQEIIRAMADLNLEQQLDLIENLANQQKGRLQIEMKEFTLEMVLENYLQEEARVSAILVLFSYFKSISSIFELISALIDLNQKGKFEFQRISYSQQLRIIFNSLSTSSQQRQQDKYTQQWEYPLKYSFLGYFCLNKFTSSLLMILCQINDFQKLLGLLSIELGEGRVLEVANLLKKKQIIKRSNLLKFYRACSHFKIKIEELNDPQV